MKVVIIGAGGTGGALLPKLGRQLFRQENLPNVELLVVDGDAVEEKNTLRQPYFLDEVGQNKAELLASKVECSFAVNCQSYPFYVESAETIQALIHEGQSGDSSRPTIVVGCVDNLKTRSVLEEWFLEANGKVVYIDSANEEDHGEVVFSVKNNKKVLSPLRSALFPSFRSQLKKENRFRSELSCAERWASKPQNFATNDLAANIICRAIMELIIGGKLPYGMVYFDSKSYYMEHKDTRGGCAKCEH